MSIYEILPALDLTQSVHAKISIGMHRVVKFKISRIPLIGLETRLGWRTDRKFLRNPNLNEIIVSPVQSLLISVQYSIFNHIFNEYLWFPWSSTSNVITPYILVYKIVCPHRFRINTILISKFGTVPTAWYFFSLFISFVIYTFSYIT
jgi:hypothetical protein